MNNNIWIIAACVAGLSFGCGGATPVDSQSSGTTTVVEETEVAEVAEEEEAGHVHIENDHLSIDRHINFATNEATILEESFDLLDEIATILQSHTEITDLHIVGHTDDVGGDANNQSLSERRAEAVLNALQERGVTQTLDHRGAGETEPVCEEDTDECRTQNRRVDFMIESSHDE